jgi:hypothetical protein
MNLKKSLWVLLALGGLTLALLVLSAVGSMALPAMGGGAGAGAVEAPNVQPPLGLVLAVMFGQVAVLAVPILGSRWHGWRLAATIFVVYYGTVTVLSQIESLIYLDGRMPNGLVPGLFAMGAFVALLFSPLAVLALGGWKKPAAAEADGGIPLRLGPWGWRVWVSGLLFLCLYYLFGYYVAWQDPALRAYYGGTDPGSFLAQMKSVVTATPWMPLLQFLRGLVWVALGLLVIRSMRGPWWFVGLATGALFAMPSLYLLFPNPAMPDFPRMTHLVETLPYQFLFGYFLAWFLTDRAPGHARAPQPA